MAAAALQREVNDLLFDRGGLPGAGKSIGLSMKSSLRLTNDFVKNFAPSPHTTR